MLKDRAVVAGIAQTPFAKRLEGTEPELACRVIVEACRDAGVDPSEIDGMASYTVEQADDVTIAQSVGAGDLTFFAQHGYGGGGAPGCIGLLAMAIAAGQCTVGVAWRSRKRGSGGRPWANAGAGFHSLAAVGSQFSRPYGMLRPADELAALTRRYMHEYGATRDHLANVALACRAHANRNPSAVMYDRPLSREDYMQARWISEPLCLFDNCLETDGALAVVMVGANRATDLPHKPVYVHAIGQGLPQRQSVMVNYFNDDPLRTPSWVSGPSLFAASDIKPGDIDVAQFYDAFTPLILLSLEGYGFCDRGEGGPFTEDGALELGGRLPINTSGGGLSEAYVHGFNLVLEGVRQMRGTSTSQVAGASSCLVTGSDSVPTSACLLRNDSA